MSVADLWTKFLVLFLTLALALPAFACPPGKDQEGKNREPSATVKVQVELVNLTVSVLDRGGHLVPDLKKQDFAIFEDGVLKEVAFFRNDQDLPVSVGILLDTSGSMVDKLGGVADALLHFVDTVNPQDDIFIMQFNSKASLVQGFTDDRAALRQAVNRLRAEGSTSLYDAIVRGLKHVGEGRRQRKALLVITDGNDTSSEIELQQAIDFAIRAEIPIYSLGIGHGELGSFGHGEGRFRDVVESDVLRGFAGLTGGRSFLLQGPHRRKGVDQIDQACQQVAAELRQQYTLAYYPTKLRKDGAYRQIRVKINKADYKARTRAGYFADGHRDESR